MRRAAPAGGGTLPCLNRDISNGDVPKPAEKKVGSRYKKGEYALTVNVEDFVQKHGLEKILFTTLTFDDHVTDRVEAQRRYNSFATGFLRPRFGKKIIRVMERQKNGRIHYHLLLPMPVDIRTGVDFKKLEPLLERGRRSKHSEWVDAGIGPVLFAEWSLWRRTAKKYGFGRTELLPIKSNGEGIAKYVDKYIGKHMGNRIDADKGARLVSYSGSARRCNSRFDWVSPGADLWRAKLGLFVRSAGGSAENYSEFMEENYGRGWAYRLGPVISAIKLPVYPTGAHYLLDYPHDRGLPGWADLGDPRELRQVSRSDQTEARESLANALNAAFLERLRHQEFAMLERSSVVTREELAQRNQWRLEKKYGSNVENRIGQNRDQELGIALFGTDGGNFRGHGSQQPRARSGDHAACENDDPRREQNFGASYGAG